MRKTWQTPVTISVGMLREDVAVLSHRVYQTLADGPRLIWADDAGRVYSSEPGNTSVEVPSAWIAGTFSFGQAMSEIEDDLRVLHDERSKDWILE